jgi:hypothetical protein
MSSEEFEYLRQAIEETNGTIEGMAVLLSSHMARVDAAFVKQDEAIQYLIDIQKHGYSKLDREIESIKKTLGMNDES